jgi:hypothetical protein
MVTYLYIHICTICIYCRLKIQSMKNNISIQPEVLSKQSVFIQQSATRNEYRIRPIGALRQPAGLQIRITADQNFLPDPEILPLRSGSDSGAVPDYLIITADKT